MPERLLQRPIADVLGTLPCDREVLTWQEHGERLTVLPDALRKMAEMGLGQLPMSVIALPDDATLLSFRVPFSQGRQRFDVRQHLTRFFTGFLVAALYELQSLFNRLEVQAYVIGGIPRDILISRERRLSTEDVDLTLEGDALACLPYLIEHSRNFALQATYPEYGTGTLIYKDGLSFDVASTRRERYTACGAMPEVLERGVPLAVDVARRDFTVNAMALSINSLGTIIDHTRGVLDLDARELRVLHAATFFEDPSRMLRAYKFAARLGFQFSAGTRQLMGQFLCVAPDVYRGGGERIKAELLAWLGTEESPAKTATLLDAFQLGVLRLLHTGLPPQSWGETGPGGIPWATLWQEMGRRLPLALDRLRPDEAPEVTTWDPLAAGVYLTLLLAALPEDWHQAVADRLGLTKAERQSIAQCLQLLADQRLNHLDEDATPEVLYDTFHGLSLTALLAALMVQAIAAPERFSWLVDALSVYQRHLAHTRPELDGHDLIRLGVPEGPAVGRALLALQRAKVSGRLAGRLEESRFVQDWLAIEQVSAS